jgi:hypothetical protein
MISGNILRFFLDRYQSAEWLWGSLVVTQRKKSCQNHRSRKNIKKKRRKAGRKGYATHDNVNRNLTMCDKEQEGAINLKVVQSIDN